MKTFPLAALAILPLALAACSDDGSSPAGSTTTGSGGAGGSGTTTSGSGGAPAKCEGEIAPGAGAEIMIDSVEATVLDLDGLPVHDELAQACGLNICFNGTTASNGHVIISPGTMIKQPAFKFGDGLDHVKLAIPLTAASTAFPEVYTPKLPPLAEGVPLLPGQDAVSAGVTVSIPEGGVVDLDVLLYDDPMKHVFRAAAIPVDRMVPTVVDPALGLEMFYGFAPIHTKFCPPARLTMPNDAGFAAGSDVEIFVMGLEVSEEWVPYGTWAKVSDGQVSADGMTISTVAGGGLPILSAIGVKAK